VDAGPLSPITVHGPKGTRDMIDGFLKFFSANRAIRLSDFPDFYKAMPEQLFNVQEIEGPGAIYEDANVEVEAIENCHFHFPSSAASNAKSYALRFKTADKTIVFSGDTGPCVPMVNFAMGADLLVHEVINLDLYQAVLKARPFSPRHMKEDHASPDEIGKLAASAKVGMVVLSHIIPGDANDPDNAYSDGVAAHYSGKIVVAKDLMGF
jgi:ribonuclease BN (tRNA processing enzyme)